MYDPLKHTGYITPHKEILRIEDAVEMRYFAYHLQGQGFCCKAERGATPQGTPRFSFRLLLSNKKVSSGMSYFDFQLKQ